MNTSFFILDLLLKSTAVLLLGFAVQHFQKRASAAQRGFIWLIVFALLSLLPIGLLSAPKVALNWLPHHEPAQTQLALPPVKVITAEVSRLVDGGAAPAMKASHALTKEEVLFFVWSLGALLVLGRRVIGEFRLRQLRRGSQPVQDVKVTWRVAQLAGEFGITRNIEVSQSASLPVPVTWSTLRPALMLPEGAAEWSDAQLDAALRHECGHIRHFDSAKRLLAQIVCAAHWFNPLVWLAARSWRTIQEQACDDLVLRSGADAESYAMQLLHAAQSLGNGRVVPAAALAMAKPSTLETRLSAIVDDLRDRHPVSRVVKIAGTVLGLVTLALGATMQLRGEDKPAAAKAAGPGDDTILIETRVIEAPAGTMRTVIGGAAFAPGDNVITSREKTAEILAQLNSTKGVEVLSAPSVATRSGQKAIIAIGRDIVVNPSDPKKTAFIGIRIAVLPTMAHPLIDLDVDASLSEQTGSDHGRPLIETRGGASRVKASSGDTLFFSSKSGAKEGLPREIIFLITPNIKGLAQGHQAAVIRTFANDADKTAEQWVKEIEGDLKSIAEGEQEPDMVVKWTQAYFEGFFGSVSSGAAAHSRKKLAVSREIIARLLQEHPKWDATLRGRLSQIDGDISRQLEKQDTGNEAKMEVTADSITFDQTKGTLRAMGSVTIESANGKGANNGAADVIIETANAGKPVAGKANAQKRAEAIILPLVELKEVKLDEAVDFVRAQSLVHDPEKKGLKIIALTADKTGGARISLMLKQVPLHECVKYVSQLFGLSLRYEDDAVVIGPPEGK